MFDPADTPLTNRLSTFVEPEYKVVADTFAAIEFPPVDVPE